jgi:predicted methyltransferase
MIISHYQARNLLQAKQQGLAEIQESVDLNISKTKILIGGGFFIFPEGHKIPEDELNKAIKNNTSCFMIKDDSLVKVQFFSEETKKFYKLFPTKDAPTIEISGIRMHTTKNFTPIQDTREKIRSISPIRGSILDTCMGLGYTAICGAQHAASLVTCEKDENVIEMAKLNPWSQALFNNPNISILKTDIFNEIKIFKNGTFDFIMHDPPRLSLATELYSLDFYKQLFRVLKSEGKIYHYTGLPGSRFRKINLRHNVGKRLMTAGFRKIEEVHYGLRAEKQP